MRVSKGKWGRLPLPCQSAGTTFPPHSTAWGLGKNFPIVVLNGRNTGGRHGQGYQPCTQIGGNRTAIPYNQGDPDHKDQHALSPQWGRERVGARRVLGHANPKDGPVAWGNIQGVHPGGTGMLRTQHVQRHEMQIQFRQHCRECLHLHPRRCTPHH